MKRFILIAKSLLLLALITFEYPLNWEVFAESPSFSRQEINTGSHNGIQVNAITHTQTKVDYKGPLDTLLVYKELPTLVTERLLMQPYGWAGVLIKIPLEMELLP